MEEKVLLKVKSDKNKKPAGPSVPPVNNAPQVSSTPTPSPAAPDNNPPMGNNEPPMDDDDSVMPDEPDDNMKGDGNEDGDDKNHIQQLAGKLSQALQSYTDEIGQPDAELNKYVANMVVKQAAQGLSDDDKDDIIKKIENSDDENEEEGGDNNMNPDGGDDNNPIPNDNNQPMPDNNNNNPMPQQESKKGKRHSKTIIMSESQFNSMFEVNNELDEVINDIIGTDGDEDNEMKAMEKPIGKGISFSSKPYVAPKF